MLTEVSVPLCYITPPGNAQIGNLFPVSGKATNQELS
jgi:hypothetical protein